MSLTIQNLSKTYGKNKALDNINLDINKGEFIAILGPSGCGKTTLLRIIAGFISPDQGKICLDQTVLTENQWSLPVEKRNLGMVFQSFALWPHLTVREHIKFPLQSRRNKALSADKKKELFKKAVQSTGLEPYINRLPGELSGGQKQRVSLARAIVELPPVLLMDEPLSSLDAELKINMRREIKEIHQLTGSTIVYVTHDQNEALAMADRIIIMKDGKIEQMDTPEKIYNQPKTEFVARFVSKSNILSGKWDSGRFYCTDHDCEFEGDGVDHYFVTHNIYPIRPEEMEIKPIHQKNEGIIGTIQDKQYNGREIHYIVKSVSGFLNVYANKDEGFKINDQVCLIKKETTQ
jgi:iron(III) transport system ATP-binding protein